MSDFTKTLIVDGSITLNVPLEDPVYPSPPYFNTIKDATDYLIYHEIGGTIIVEQGTYTIDDSDPSHSTISVPSNVTIIGRGNAVIEVTADVSAFVNKGQTLQTQTSNERITISGFKIIVSYNNILLYRKHVVDFKGVNNCLIEKLYITYDQEQTYGVERNFSAISIWGNSNPEIISRDNVIKQCSVVDFGKNSNIGEGNDNHYGAGIILHTKCERNKIYNNYLNGTAGVYCEDASYTTVSNNIFSYGKRRTHIPSGGNGGAGICTNTCPYTTITGNQMNHNESHGIYLTSECTTVSGNVCISNGDNPHEVKHGIRIAYGTTNYNTVVGNVCCENYASGIQLGGAANKGGAWYNTVCGNSCCNNNDHGIFLSTSVSVDDDKIKHTILEGNMCYGNTDSPIQYSSALTEDIVEADNITS